MTDDEFRRLIADYLDTAAPDTAGVELDMAEGEKGYGADHALEKHDVTQEEIRQVIFELPSPEEKCSKHAPERTILWGVTRKGREIAVVVLDEVGAGKRHMTLVTAFDESEAEWRRRR